MTSLCPKLHVTHVYKVRRLIQECRDKYPIKGNQATKRKHADIMLLCDELERRTKPSILYVDQTFKAKEVEVRNGMAYYKGE